MQKAYLPLTIIGTLLPSIFVFQESISSGNILLYRYPIDTFNTMFANNISAAFCTDLLFIVILFLVYSYQEAKKHNINNLYLIWIYTFAFGIAGGLPLFFYVRSKSMKTQNPI